MNDPNLLLFGMIAFSLMLIGLVLTIYEFRNASRTRNPEGKATTAVYPDGTVKRADSQA